jgi:hypothetical protein
LVAANTSLAIRSPERLNQTRYRCLDDSQTGNWLAALDDFRNWLALGLQPAKGHENQVAGQNGTGGSGEIESSQWSR